MKSTVNHIYWRIMVGTITFNVSVSKTDNGYLAEFGRDIPPLRCQQINRSLIKNHILKYKKVKEFC